jgi:isoleucyl-tRNA synthetase
LSGDAGAGAEGIARDLVRVIQQARRDKGLDVSDRIRLTIDAPENVTAAARAHEGLIRSETLALDVAYGAVSDGVGGKVGDGVPVEVGLSLVASAVPQGTT